MEPAEEVGLLLAFFAVSSETPPFPESLPHCHMPSASFLCALFSTFPNPMQVSRKEMGWEG